MPGPSKSTVASLIGAIRRASASGALPFAAAALFAAGAFAAYDTTWIGPGKPVSSANLKANLDDLQSRLAALESGAKVYVNPQTGARWSLAASYCGSTAPTTGNFLGAVAGATSGYVAGATLCQAVAGCTASAHVCTNNEIIRQVSTGSVLPPGWYMVGDFSTSYPTSRYSDTYDCVGWSDGSSNTLGGNFGTTWTGTTPGDSFCATANPVLCCD